MVLHRKMRVYTNISFLVRITTPSSNFLSVATIRIEYLHLPLNIGYSGVHFEIYISLFRKNCSIFLLRIYTDFFDITLKVNALNFCTKFCTKLTFFCRKFLSAWGSSEVIYDLFWSMYPYILRTIHFYFHEIFHDSKIYWSMGLLKEAILAILLYCLNSLQ